MKCIIYTVNDDSIRIGCFEREDGKENPYMALTSPEKHAADIVSKTSELIGWRIGDSTDLPGGKPDGTYDRMFFPEFTDINHGTQIDVDMVKALAKAHMIRRLARTTEMAPLDIQATIPSEAAAAETARQQVRDRNAVIQINLDEAAIDGYAALAAALRQTQELKPALSLLKLTR
jgi:hypothetical protein